MKITGEMWLEVDNEIYTGTCRLLELDEYDDDLYCLCFNKVKALIGERKFEIFPVMSHFREGDVESDMLTVYLLSDDDETLLGQQLKLI